MSTRNLPGLFFFLAGWDWVHLVLRPQPQMIDDGDCGATGGIKTGRGNRSTRRKAAPVPLCSPQIPHDLNRARTRAAAVGNQRLTAWTMARPFPGGNGRPARKADNLSKPIVYKIWELRRLTNLWASKASYFYHGFYFRVGTVKIGFLLELAYIPYANLHGS
jgi:hypothetical protein